MYAGVRSPSPEPLPRRRPGTGLADHGVDLHRQGGAGAVAQISNVGAWNRPTAWRRHRLLTAWSVCGAIRGGPALLAWLRTVDGRGCLLVLGNAACVSRAPLEAWMNEIARQLHQMSEDAP